MQDWNFNCPAYLAQRFWIYCAERDQTPGALLRRFMIDQISKADPGFEVDLDAWVEAQNRKRPRPAPARVQVSTNK